MGVLIDGCYYTFKELIDINTPPSAQATLPDLNVTPVEQPTAEGVVAEVEEEAMVEDQQEGPPPGVFLYLSFTNIFMGFPRFTTTVTLHFLYPNGRLTTF